MRYDAVLSANETLFQLLKLGLAGILCFDPGAELLKEPLPLLICCAFSAAV